MRLVLAVRDLQGIGELRLVLAGLQAPAAAADLVPQQEPGDPDARGRNAEDETGGPGRGRVRDHVIGACVVSLRRHHAVEVVAGQLVGGRQPGRERRGRLGCQVRRAEQVTDGIPLPDEQGHVGAFGRRIGDVQPFQRHEMPVDRGDQAGVQRAEEPGPHRGISGPHDGFADRVRHVHVPGQLARHHRGGQLVARDHVSLPRGRPDAQDADGGHRGQHERAKERYQQDVRGVSKRRIHLHLTRQASHKAFTLLIITAGVTFHIPPIPHLYAVSAAKTAKQIGKGLRGARTSVYPRAPRARPALRRHHARGHPDPGIHKRHTPAAQRPAHPCGHRGGTKTAAIAAGLAGYRPDRSADRFLTSPPQPRGRSGSSSTGRHPSRVPPHPSGSCPKIKSIGVLTAKNDLGRGKQKHTQVLAINGSGGNGTAARYRERR